MENSSANSVLADLKEQFGKAFDSKFLCQGQYENRSITQTLDLGWDLLGILPRSELDRVSDEILDKYYKPKDNQ